MLFVNRNPKLSHPDRTLGVHEDRRQDSFQAQFQSHSQSQSRFSPKLDLEMSAVRMAGFSMYQQQLQDQLEERSWVLSSACQGHLSCSCRRCTFAFSSLVLYGLEELDNQPPRKLEIVIGWSNYLRPNINKPHCLIFPS